MASEAMREYGSQIMLSTKVIEADREGEVRARIARLFSGSFVQALIIDRRKIVSLSLEVDRSRFASVEFSAIADSIPDESLASLVAQMDVRQAKLIDAILAVNRIPLWRLIWAKIKRTPLSSVSNDRSA